MSAAAPLLQAEGLRKRFGGTEVLRGVSLAVAAGEVHAVVGGNGSGKSTTMNLLCGRVARDGGTVRLDGRALALASPREAAAAGIAGIAQQPRVFAELTVAENLLLTRLPRRRGRPWIDFRALRRRARAALDDVGLACAPDTPAAGLSPGERQLLEVARALSSDARVVIFDEPTSALGAAECARLEALIRRLRGQGLAIVYVSHQLDDVFRLADRITVLRDGAVAVPAVPAAAIAPREVVQAIAGRPVEQIYPPRPQAPAAPQAPLLQAERLGRAGAFDGISFTLRAGEILGIAGAMGAGRTALARALFGLDAHDCGSVRIGGRRLAPGRVRERIAEGIAMLTEDRLHDGLLAHDRVDTNLALAALPRHARGTFGRLDGAALRAAAIGAAAAAGVAAAADPLPLPAGALSGGNQQKVVLGKWLLCAPRVLILDEPTRGVDVGARAEIYRRIAALAAGGTALLLISSDPDELLGLADRLIVMRRGRVVAAFDRPDFDRERVLAAALGAGREGEAR